MVPESNNTQQQVEGEQEWPVSMADRLLFLRSRREPKDMRKYICLLIGLTALFLMVLPAATQQKDLPKQARRSQRGVSRGCSVANPNLEQIAFRLPGISVNAGGVQSSTQQELAFHSYSAFWEAGGGYSSTLFLRNRDEQGPVTANIVILSHDGTRMQKSQLVIAANSVGRLALAEFIKTEDPNPQWGSVILEFRQPSRTFGSVIVENYQQGIIFDMPIQGGYRYDTENALSAPWWFPDLGTDGAIMLFNSSERDITVSTSIVAEGSDRLEPAFNLAPHETKRLNLRELTRGQGLSTPNQGMIVLRYSGPPHSLFPALLLSNPKTGFSLVPDFNALHQTTPGSTTWQFPAVFLSPDPQLG